jgi:hypothetical protein
MVPLVSSKSSMASSEIHFKLAFVHGKIIKLHFGIFSASHEGNSDRSEDWFKGTSKPETMENHEFTRETSRLATRTQRGATTCKHRWSCLSLNLWYDGQLNVHHLYRWFPITTCHFQGAFHKQLRFGLNSECYHVVSQCVLTNLHHFPRVLQAFFTTFQSFPQREVKNLTFDTGRKNHAWFPVSMF